MGDVIIFSGTEHKMKLKFSMLTYLTHINTILEYYHALVINRSMMSMFRKMGIYIIIIIIKQNKVTIIQDINKKLGNLLFHK